jgi:hypothetical protein
MTLATHLLDLQKSVLDFQKTVFQEPALNDCKVSGFIPLVIESYAIYNLTVWLLKRLAERKSFTKKNCFGSKSGLDKHARINFSVFME